MPQLTAGSARLVIADPPYFQVLTEQPWDMQWPDEDSYLTWTAQWIEAAMQLLAPGGLLYCFGQIGKRENAMLHLMSQASRQWQFHDMIVWDRVVGYNNRRDSFNPAYEMILVLRREGKVRFNKDAVREPYDEKTVDKYAKDKRYKNLEARQAHLSKGKFATNLWRIPSLRGTSLERAGHPSQKPRAVIERIILSSSAPGDLVVDPFLGSGTTALVAQATGRNWIGIEADEKYVALAEKRVAKERGK